MYEILKLYVIFYFIAVFNQTVINIHPKNPPKRHKNGHKIRVILSPLN